MYVKMWEHSDLMDMEQRSKWGVQQLFPIPNKKVFLWNQGESRDPRNLLQSKILFIWNRGVPEPVNPAPNKNLFSLEQDASEAVNRAQENPSK